MMNTSLCAGSVILLSSLIRHLMTSLTYLVTLWRGLSLTLRTTDLNKLTEYRRLLL